MGRPPLSAISTATPERILDAARIEFAAAGFAQAKLADIAATAGITRPSLLYHFDSKEALYAATVARCFDGLARALAAQVTATGPFVDRLRATMQSYLAFVESEPEVARIVLRELVAGTGPGADILMNQVAPLVDLVERFIRMQGRGVVRGDVPLRAAILQIATDGLVRAAAGPLRVPLWGAEDHAQKLAELLLLEEEYR
ncbi:MAG: TetR/AcrR family transcriptional regulator [Deltaproteobacteria bacterium]|nr:TetR/AcrR family transcriptional regulator [Deltaproteobacteria bacterium]MBK8239244.1 TetR/AcrR family transcriptional regulator [Deltaproteobacteria bacterium]MBK8719680.1 TetR/AcrR family transcriptional regulator [Deltaproteobacteria bacterium]MBP7289624.1 TetR/AcrR family transcriptional regulator [Nannocystaceae bacterium]